MLVSSEVLPSWLSVLLAEKFFNACIIHEDCKKNEKNVFCLDCCEGICPHCLPSHTSHRLLQIRRYVYHDVIRLLDASKLMDCSHVQMYTTNSAKVVFLNQRPQARPPRASGSLCVTCDRNLQESYLFCSLFCKIQHILQSGGKLSDHLRSCEFLALPEPGLDDGQLTPESVLDPDPATTESGSSSECHNVSCTATTEAVVRKKRSNLVSVCRNPFRTVCRPASLAGESRRKSTPHRSPFH